MFNTIVNHRLNLQGDKYVYFFKLLSSKNWFMLNPCRQAETGETVMLFYNANIFTTDGYVLGGFEIENGRFTAILPGLQSGEGVDLCGAKVIPGLVDIHIHGAMGHDFSDGDADGLTAIGRYLASYGVTSFLPTSVTLPFDVLSKAFRTAAQLCADRPDDCARVMGVRMEGPFLSEEKRGAQNAAHLRTPDFAAFCALYNECGGIVRIVDVSPELTGAESFIRKASALCAVSVAHTNASYDEASAAFDAGCSHLTHLYNAMPPLHHREPGVIGAAAERDAVSAELICDGLHVHPSAVRMAFQLFPDRICLVSDTLRCCGMPYGVYDLGEQATFLKDGAARLADGTLAGAATNLFEGMRNAIRFGIPEETAIRAATIRPAQVIGADDEIGSIAVGMMADFMVCDDDLNVQSVYSEGSKLF